MSAGGAYSRALACKVRGLRSLIVDSMLSIQISLSSSGAPFHDGALLCFCDRVPVGDARVRRATRRRS